MEALGRFEPPTCGLGDCARAFAPRVFNWIRLYAFVSMVGFCGHLWRSWGTAVGYSAAVKNETRSSPKKEIQQGRRQGPTRKVSECPTARRCSICPHRLRPDLPVGGSCPCNETLPVRRSAAWQQSP